MYKEVTRVDAHSEFNRSFYFKGTRVWYNTVPRVLVSKIYPEVSMHEMCFILRWSDITPNPDATVSDIINHFVGDIEMQQAMVNKWKHVRTLEEECTEYDKMFIVTMMVTNCY